MSFLKQVVDTYGAQYPWAIFLALVLLPGFAFPASALLLLAGAVWGSTASSCGIALGAILLNVTWTHLLAAGPCKTLVTRILGKHGERLFAMPQADLMKLAWILRVTPAVPLFVQNYGLGVLGVPLRHSLLTAIPVTGLYICGFVLTGGAIFNGRFGLVVTGAGLLIAATVATRLLRKRYAEGKANGGS
ncbi:MAG: hypothetical protein EAZ71_06920 [Verrucomicrobia bacterium]|nr:MAG: hypothetical protein EAZ82_12535 [Verrucomicrobiota bacterium]TAF25868.1 MAG: hypothetical protein EAZ71_06920 [Verrucomicrobiota bacterium]